MNTEIKLVHDLESYVKFKIKKDTDITIQLRDALSKMDEEELAIAEKFYEKLQSAEIRTLGNIGCVELAVKLTQWLYPRLLREAYAERSKDYMLAP